MITATTANGFMDTVLETMAQPVAEDSTNIKMKTAQELQDAVARHKLAEQVLSIKGSYAPRFVSIDCDDMNTK